MSKPNLNAMAFQPVVSVVIVSHNSRTHLPACLESLHQASRLPVQVILVDNASQDGSSEWVARQYPTAQVVNNRLNLGFAAGNNIGAQLARGKYLFFLNPDTTVGPGAIDRLVAALEADPQVGLATAKILLPVLPEPINACGNTVHLSGLTLCRGAGMSTNALPDPLQVSAISGAAFMISRQLYQVLDGFDEDFFLYLEDTDLSLRARLAGRGCVYVPQAIVYHDYRLRLSAEKIYFLERNRYLMLFKLFRWPTLVLLLPVLVLAEIVAWGYVLLEMRHLHSKLRAYTWLPAHWRLSRQKRSATQALRCVSDRNLLSLHSARLDFSQIGDGLLQQVSAMVFNPLFQVLNWLLKGLVWW